MVSGARAVANPERYVPQAKRSPTGSRRCWRRPTRASPPTRDAGPDQRRGAGRRRADAGDRALHPARRRGAGRHAGADHVAGHPFWTTTTRPSAGTSEIHFLKNLGLLGGLLLAAADTQGKPGCAGGPATRSTTPTPARRRRGATARRARPASPAESASRDARRPPRGRHLPGRPGRHRRSKAANHLNHSPALTRWKCREPVWDRTRSDNARRHDVRRPF